MFQNSLCIMPKTKSDKTKTSEPNPDVTTTGVRLSIRVTINQRKALDEYLKKHQLEQSKYVREQIFKPIYSNN